VRSRRNTFEQEHWCVIVIWEEYHRKDIKGRTSKEGHQGKGGISKEGKEGRKERKGKEGRGKARKEGKREGRQEG
jgi:hypothetical protein